MSDDPTPPMISQMPGHLIRRLHQQSTQVFQQKVAAAGFDLTPVQFAALDVLADCPGIDQASVAMQIAKDRATIGAVIDRLVGKGLIARTVSKKDKRARVLSLTDQGHAMVGALRPVVKDAQRDILPGLTPEEFDRFVELAGKAANAAANLAVRTAPAK